MLKKKQKKKKRKKVYYISNQGSYHALRIDELQKIKISPRIEQITTIQGLNNIKAPISTYNQISNKHTRQRK